MKVQSAYFRIVGKPPEIEKLDILESLLDQSKEYYSEHKQEAYELAKSRNIELASLTLMVNSLMNLDEFIMKN